MSSASVYRSGRAPDLALGHRERLRHIEAVFDGREPPGDFEPLGDTDCADEEPDPRSMGEALVRLMGFPLGTDPRLVVHYIKLGGALGEIGTELRDQREERDRAQSAKCRKRKMERYKRERARGLPPPLDVVRCVAACEKERGEWHGAAAAAAQRLGKSPSFISNRLKVVNGWRKVLELARRYFLLRIKTGGGDQSELAALPELLAQAERLLRKLPPGRWRRTAVTPRGRSRLNRTFSKHKRGT